jgi:hypothetical protein
MRALIRSSREDARAALSELRARRNLGRQTLAGRFLRLMAYQGLGLGLRLRSAACAESLWSSRPPLNKRKKRRRRCATALRDVRRRDGRNAQTAVIQTA